ncbi:protease inhibitor I42 family protein [Methanoregula sp. UBA64]|jgi:predicted secreted protein|uniref:protease inhibitor I42 family protein n=1 Tax=Methanoregula sp. UBA64 TaxID=1915554 RepID=UPI0025F077EF|nr:protease inhibitor I42 family protein [Methanoregula sp. UBA64]
MRKPLLILMCTCCMLFAAGLAAGCVGSAPTGHESPAATAVPSVPVTPNTTVMTPVLATPTASAATTSAGTATVFVNSSADDSILVLPATNHVLVRLSENPTTGYVWNATASRKLSVIQDTYTAPTGDLMGASGTHEWILAPQGVDTYTFTAVQLRPWEGATATDKTFTLVIVATPE